MVDFLDVISPKICEVFIDEEVLGMGGFPLT